MKPRLQLYCHTQAGCETCRNLAGGRQFRVELAEHYELPVLAVATAPDFECIAADPKPWDWREPESARTAPPTPPTPFEDWPAWAKAAAAMKADGDVGVGDTIARRIGPLGGDAFKSWYKALTGRECGCDRRQADMNRMYTYDVEVAHG